MRPSRPPFGLLLALATIALVAASESRCLSAQGEITGSSNVYLRSGPGADYTTVGTLNAGDQVVILETQGVWTKVATADGRVGYLNHRFVSPIAEPQAELSATPAIRARGEGAATVAAAPSPTVKAEGTKPELTAEMADLRAEITELKRKIGEQRSVEATDRRPPTDGAATSTASTPSAAKGPDGDAAVSTREQGVGVLAVGLLGLIIGWVAGSTFTRRRSRSQRSRLRF